MADRTIKPDDTNDLVLQNNDGSSKLELNEDQTVKVTTGSDAGEDFTVNSTQLVVEGDSGHVGIGTGQPPARLSIEGSSNTLSEISLKNTAPNPDAHWTITPLYDSDTLSFRSANNSSAQRFNIHAGGGVTVNGGNLIIGTAGKGIDFSADSHASKMDSEILDDYETGVLDNPVSFGGVSQGSSNFSQQNSDYTKIGNKVFVNIDYDTNANDLAAAGPVTLNLPFTSNQLIVLYVQAYMNSWNQWVLEVPRTSSTATFYTSSFAGFSLATNQRSIASLFLVYTTG